MNLKRTLRNAFPFLTIKYRTVRDKFSQNEAYYKSAYMEALSMVDQINSKPFDKKMVEDFERNTKNQTYSSARANIETNNSCNIDCAMCQTSSSTRVKGIMEDELLEHSIEELVKNGRTDIAVHTIGEPTANPKFKTVLKLFRKNGIVMGLSTNGLLIHKHIENIIEYRDVCPVVHFSVDGATKETYEKIRIRGNWDKLIENINLAYKTLRKNGVPLKFSLCMSKDNVHEIGDFIVRFRDYVENPSKDLYVGAINSLAPDNTYFNHVNIFPNHTYLNSPCWQVGTPTPHILIDGRVSACCRDYDGSIVIGDINKNSLKEILQGDKLKSLTEEHRSKNLKDRPLCESCFVVDDRVNDIFGSLLERTLKRNPRETSEFYQNIVNNFIKLFQKKPSREEVQHLFDAV